MLKGIITTRFYLWQKGKWLTKLCTRFIVSTFFDTIYLIQLDLQLSYANCQTNTNLQTDTQINDSQTDTQIKDF